MAIDPKTISLDDQIKEVGRELGMRRATYPKWIGNRMTQAEADQRIAAMEAAYGTLKAMKADRDSEINRARS